MSKLTREAAEAEYDKAVAGIANQLRALANEVERAGYSYTSGPDPRTRAWTATEVVNVIHRWLARGDLGVLIFRAIEAEHATARSTPGELLDLAITGLEGIMGAADATAAEMADLALRGAGVIR